MSNKRIKIYDINEFVNNFIDDIFNEFINCIKNKYHYNAVDSGMCDVPFDDYIDQICCDFCREECCLCIGCSYQSGGQLHHMGTYGCLTRNRKKVN